MRQYIDTCQDTSGNALPGATCTVQNYPSGSLANIYSDNGLSLIPLSVVTADVTGQFSFFAADGDYILVLADNGTTYKTQSPVSLFDGAAQVTFADVGGAANIYGTTSTALEKALRAGLRASIQIANSNTGASTYAYNTLAAKPITYAGGAAINSGTLLVNGIYQLEYDGANWQIRNNSNSSSLNYPPTAVEAAIAGITINQSINYFDYRRYGCVPNSTAAAAANSTIMAAVFNPLIAGMTGTFYTPSIIGGDIYSFANVIPCRQGITVDASGCTHNFIGSGVSADSNSGLYMAINDFCFKNGQVTVTYATGVATSAGNAFWFGVRGADSARWPVTPVYDSTQTIPMGGIRLENVRISSTISGANVGSSAMIAMTGGLQGVWFNNVTLVGSGTGGVHYGIQYEFGWATAGTTGDTGQSSRQTSHLRDFHCDNINISGMDNVSGSAVGIFLTGAYSSYFTNVWIAGCSQGITCNPGEAQYFRPWVGQDDVGTKHCMVLKNIVIENASSSGVLIQGTAGHTGGPIVNNTYLWHQWVALTTVVAGQTVFNSNNMYVTAAGGVTGNTGGPTTTGSAIADGSVTWAYVDLRSFTDLIEFTMEGFAITCTSTGNPVFSYAGYMGLKDGICSGGASGIVLSEETTRFDIDGVVCQGCGNSGIQADFTASQIWSTARLKRGTIKNSKFAGNSVSSSGTYGGISIKNFDGVTVENCRFGYEPAQDFVSETTQAQGIFISSTTAGANANMRVRGCRFAGAVGGVGVSNNSTTSNQGNIIEGCTANTSNATNPITAITSGAWMSTDLESLTAPIIVNGNTITTSGLATSRVAPGGAVTGIVLQKGSYQGQKCTVINESAAGSTVTFAVVGTSFVADGVSCVLAGLRQMVFAWDTSTSLWYHS